MANTKHSPGCKMVFGRKDPNCPRCQELIAGAPARDGWQKGYYQLKAHNDAIEKAAIAAHFAPGGPHATGKCGPVCTAFDY
jgi:hypothetical protein